MASEAAQAIVFYGLISKALVHNKFIILSLMFEQGVSNLLINEHHQSDQCLLKCNIKEDAGK